MAMTKAWFISVGFPALIYLLSFGYALYRTFQHPRSRFPRATRIYWISCAFAIVLGTAITIDIANRSPDATALASLGMLIACIGILGVLVGFAVNMAMIAIRCWGRKCSTS
ncbi:conserved hypothetical protein [Burkholderia ambifaria MEX-5]|uniref:Transmembrane protein n=1 Tax=Burkholderia ambifaria MEX-5 TaxID=396597 RepID=B1TFU7_9BURK|nr:conserved hypothetical protein [Burkholderia ambifaria MEX-5]